MHYILVPGTWSIKDNKAWWADGSPFRNYLSKQGISTSVFLWSTKLDGVVGQNDHWLIAGRQLANSLAHTPSSDINILAHSHGCQVAWYTLGLNGLKVNRLVTIAGPIRKEMAVWRSLSAIRSQGWTHIHASYKDWWQWFGSFFDGSLAFTREAPEASKNIKVGCSFHGDEPGGLLDYEVWNKYDLAKVLH